MPSILWQDLPNRTLKDKIVRTLAEVASRIVDALTSPIREGLHNLHDWAAQKWTDEADRQLGPYLAELRAMEGMTPELQAYIDRLRERRSPAFWVLLIAAIVTMAVGFAGQILTGPMRLWSMKWMRRFTPARASVSQTAEAWAQGWLSEEYYQSEMLDMGFHPMRADFLKNIAMRWPTITYTWELLNRGEIDDITAVQYLRLQGYPLTAAQNILKLRMEVPGIQDLIRFAVREAYTPALAERLELYEDFPSAMMPDATKRGLSLDYARKYWAAHWQLPSVTQAFEMMHRRALKKDGTPFTADDMGVFLRVADYSPPWRNLLIQIAYNPYTRRELPRLYRLGVITQEQMLSAYMDLGLSPEKAQTLVNASIREAREISRDLTRADIEAGYKRHLLPPEAAAAALASMGFDEDEVAYILARVDYDKAQSRVSSRKTTIKRRYVAATIDHVEATRQLAEAGVEAAEIADLLVDWTEERAAKVERPTLATLEQMYRRRLISGPDLASELAGHGYSDRYVQLLIANIEADIAEENAKRTEAERRRQAVKVKLPTKADLLDWLAAGIITQDDMRRRMSDQGYLAEDIDRYLQEEGIVVIVPTYRTEEGKVRVATLKLARRAENITAVELLTGLMDLDMPASLADAIVEYEEVKLGPEQS